MVAGRSSHFLPDRRISASTVPKKMPPSVAITVKDTLKIAEKRLAGITITPDGKSALVALRDEQGVMVLDIEGYKVVTMEEAADKADIFVTATGNVNVITHEHMKRMKHQAIVCNIGHFDSEIEIAALRQYTWENIKPQVDHVIFPDGKRLIILAEGRLVNLGCATGHPSFVMSNSFTNQVLAQIELFKHGAKYDKQVYVLPKHLDEKVAQLHLARIGVKLTQLTQEQADYIGVPVQGPYKPEHYKY